DGSLVDEQDGFADANGDFTFYTEANPAPKINGSPFLTQMSVKASHWLRRRLIPSQPNTPVEYPTALFFLINGDANQDNRIDNLDVAFVTQRINTAPGGSGYDVNADINGDGFITALDLAIIQDHIGAQGDN